MQIKDGFVVDSTPEVVWTFLHDIPRVSQCVPGAENVREVEPDHYQGRLEARAGVVKVGFDGQVVVVERVEPERLVATIQADDKKLASTVTATFTVLLLTEENGTRVDYEIDITVRGRLAQIGFGPVRQVMRKMTREFATCLQESLAAYESQTAADSPQ